MISIIVAVKDNVLYTKRCIETVLTHTTVPFELIVIDNASGQDMREYLATVPQCTVVRNAENKGCSFAWNQGIAQASGDYICIINNDIEVPPQWLTRLLAVYEKEGMALLSPAMREGALDYDLAEASASLHTALGGRRYFYDEYRGVCLFTSTEIFDRIGVFDTAFAIGKYEDEDFFWRLKEENLSVCVCSDVLVHHYGSKTISAVKPVLYDFEKRNRRYFKKKWRHKYLARKWLKWRLHLRHTWVAWRYNRNY